MKTIREILESISQIEVSNCQYYKFLSLNTFLTSVKSEKIVQEELILTPYYICEKGILEIYDYELNVRLVEKKDSNGYFLKKTGKTALEEIDKCVLKKLTMCYIELINENLGVDIILNYIKFVLESNELKARIEKIDDYFDYEKLFFEVY